jgi:hypothetical protein
MQRGKVTRDERSFQAGGRVVGVVVRHGGAGTRAGCVGRGARAKRPKGGAPEREHESGPVSSRLAADRQRSHARAAEDGPRGAGGRDNTGNPACVLIEGGVRQRKGFAVAASTLLAVVRPSEGRPPRRLSCPRPAREGGGGPRPRSHARRRPTGSRSSGAGTTALAWGRAVVDLPTSIPSSRA